MWHNKSSYSFMRLFSFLSKCWLTLCVSGVWVLQHPPMCCALTLPFGVLFLTLSLSLLCVWFCLCLCSIPPVFHAYILIRISTGRKNPYPLDSAWSYCIPEVHFSEWCVELWYSHVGSYVVWRETILGHEQSRRK